MRHALSDRALFPSVFRLLEGDSLSLAPFALVVSVVVHPLYQRFLSIWGMLYADDLLLFFEGLPSLNGLQGVFELLKDSGEYSRMHIKFSKTVVMVKNTGFVKWIEALQHVGVSVKHFVQYLGIHLGNVVSKQDFDRGLMGLTVDQAFGPALTEAMRWARSLTRLHLTLDECVYTLQAWIHPGVAWVSKAYFPTASVVSQLKLVHTVALSTDSRGITAKQLSQNKEMEGGAS